MEGKFENPMKFKKTWSPKGSTVFARQGAKCLHQKIKKWFFFCKLLLKVLVFNIIINNNEILTFYSRHAAKKKQKRRKTIHPTLE